MMVVGSGSGCWWGVRKGLRWEISSSSSSNKRRTHKRRNNNRRSSSKRGPGVIVGIKSGENQHSSSCLGPR